MGIIIRTTDRKEIRLRSGLNCSNFYLNSTLDTLFNVKAYLLLIISSLGQEHAHHNSMFLLQPALYSGIAFLHKSALKFYLASLLLPIVFSSPSFSWGHL